MSETAADADRDAPGEDDDAYSGLLSAFPYAFRSSSSRLFKLYAVVGTLLLLFASFVVALGLVALFGATTGAAGGTFTFVRAFYFLVLVTALAPLLAPVLLVARRHRRGAPIDARDEALFGSAGFLYVISLWLMLVITAPDDERVAVDSTNAVVDLLVSLPRAAGLVPPLVVVALMYAAARLTRE